ncbi:putative leucine-rich repeat domain superfamily [Helianthus annuus]|nr:putative leucine-rich repeat domain superfamily [Helianthus annuus]
MKVYGYKHKVYNLFANSLKCVCVCVFQQSFSNSLCVHLSNTNTLHGYLYPYIAVLVEGLDRWSEPWSNHIFRSPRRIRCILRGYPSIRTSFNCCPSQTRRIVDLVNLQTDFGHRLHTDRIQTKYRHKCTNNLQDTDKLRLDNELNRYHPVWQRSFPCLVNLPCLKTLDIVVYTNPFVNAFKFISGCPVLESLSLEVTKCNSEEDLIFNIPTLKRQKLSFIKCTSVLNKVVLNVPNLECLFVHGVLSPSFVMEDVSPLVEASISCTQMRNPHLWFELLKGINGVKSLSAYKVISHINFKSPLSSPLPVFQNVKHLELKGVCEY